MARRQSPFSRARDIQAFRDSGGPQSGWAQRRDQLLAGAGAQDPNAAAPVVDPNAVAAGMKMQQDREAQEQYWRSLRASMQKPGPLVAPPVPTTTTSAPAAPAAAPDVTQAPGWGAEPVIPVAPPPPAPVPTAAPPTPAPAPTPVPSPTSVATPAPPQATPTATAPTAPAVVPMASPGDPGWAAYVASIGGSQPAYIKPPWQIEYERTGQLPPPTPAPSQLSDSTASLTNPSPGMDLKAAAALSAALDASGSNYDQTNNPLRALAQMRDQPWLYKDVLSKYKPEEIRALGIAPGSWNQAPPPPDPTTGAPTGLGMANRNGPSTTSGPSMLPPAPPPPIPPPLPPKPVETGTVGNSPTNPGGGVNAPVTPTGTHPAPAGTTPFFTQVPAPQTPPAPPPPTPTPTATTLPPIKPLTPPTNPTTVAPVVTPPSASSKLAGAIQDAIKPPTTAPPGTPTTKAVPVSTTQQYGQPPPPPDQPDNSRLAYALHAQNTRKTAQQNGITSGTTTAGTAY